MTFARTSFSSIVLLGCLIQTSGASAQSGQPENLGFEQPIGTDRYNWRNTSPQAYEVKLLTDDPVEGKQYAELRSVREPGRNDFGNIMRVVDAKPYRGKSIRFRGYVRLKPGSTGTAALWFRVDRPNRKMGFFDNMGDRPITDSSWKPYEIVGEVAEDAEDIAFGCMLEGAGTVDFDAVSFGELEPSQRVPFEPARALTDRELRNVTAFTKLYGYMRFFYPSDAAVASNWDNVAINGVRFVDSATTDIDLATRLQTFFAPIAPYLQVVGTGGVPKQIDQQSKPGVGPVAWLHDGVQLHKDEQGIYHSFRIQANGENYDNPIPAGTYGGVQQSLAAVPFAGKTVTFSISGSGYGHATRDASATLAIWAYKNGWTLIPNAERDVTFGKTVNGKSNWSEASVSASIPKDVDSIRVSCRTYGMVPMSVDDASLTVNGSTKNYLKDPSFETNFTSWQGSPTELYREMPTVAVKHSGNASIVVMPSVSLPDVEYPTFPSTEPQEFELVPGIRCVYPLALKDPSYPTPGHTLDVLPTGYRASGNDRATRLADIVITWNIIQHFFPYFDVVKTDWSAALPWALKNASVDKDETSFELTLQRMLALLNDGHGFVAGPSGRPHAPFAVINDNGKYVISELEKGYAGDLHLGDVVLNIAGKPVSYWYSSVDSLTPAGSKQSHDYRVYQNLFESMAIDPRGGDSVAVEVSRADGTRQVIAVEPVGYPRFAQKRPGSITELKPGIMYVDLNTVSDTEFNESIAKLAKANAIIFDMRGYPGKIFTQPIAHMIDTTVTSARWNVPVVMYPDRKNWKWDFQNWDINPQAPRFTKNIIHLTDGEAVSAAETYMGIIEHYHIGKIVGDVTAGTNGNVNPFALPGKYRVVWTGMKVLKHDGSQHHLIGISPDVTVKPTLQGIRDGRDEVLERGIAEAERMMGKK